MKDTITGKKETIIILSASFYSNSYSHCFLAGTCMEPLGSEQTQLILCMEF